MECNKELIEEVALENKVTRQLVEEITSHYGHYIATVIRTGSLEGVIVPYLGKFQVKMKSIQYKDYWKALTPEMRQLLQQNLLKGEGPDE